MMRICIQPSFGADLDDDKDTQFLSNHYWPQRLTDWELISCASDTRELIINNS